MGASTSAGTVISIGTTTDATSPPDTYQAIGEVTNIPEFGRVYNVIKYNPIGSRGTQKFKGSYDDGTITIEAAKVGEDAGQAACQTALASDLDYNFKIVANDATATLTTPSQQTFKAKVTSYTTNYSSVDNVTMTKIVLEIKSGSLVDTARSA